MKTVQTVLHPTDFSDASQPAFEEALEMAKTQKAKLVLVHVREPVTQLSAYLTPATYEQVEQAAETAARKQFDGLLARAKKAGVTAADLSTDGIPSEQIIAEAKRQKADIIVMGTHGRTGMQKLLLGSVAERVVAGAPCPVLTVRAR
jgi:nucleotide-binding universal stress UspA family protein